MGSVATLSDSNWPRASSLLVASANPERRNAALVGVATYATSLSARSPLDTPGAIRRALERYATWSFRNRLDLLEHVALVDYGDVIDPDGPGGGERVREVLARVDASVALRVILGGDNAATWHALHALASEHYAGWGLVTLDAHFDLRDGVSNGSPVRQLIADGLEPTHVVQVGLADFSNSAAYARRAHDLGIHVISRDELRAEPIEVAMTRAVALAAGAGRRVYVDVDLDVADRAVVPACPAAAPGGLSADELRRALYVLGAAPSVAAIDLTEIDLARDSADERTVRLAALLVLEALAGLARRVL